MRSILRGAGLVGLSVCFGCASYVPPESVGLKTGAPYPQPGDICVVAEPNAVTQSLSTTENDLIACPTHERGAISDRKREGFTALGQVGPWTLLQGALEDKQVAASPYAGEIIDRTSLYYDRFHGTQVAYVAEDGQEWLWYPGNTIALPGYWKIVQRGDLEQICFRYPSSSINPVTGVAGPEWECTSLEAHKADLVAQQDGDVFGLSSGRIPFVLERQKRYDFEALSQ